ncbi:MAG: type II toxin-antitoxin system HicB family antitoxin [Mesorhizobium sp.]|uniref:hypothetical protein n=1 Tax=Mesorhizobium sp. TaxID=1871066 RepID=UPI00120C3FBE|nr:hypothetical protein [Mesorhizobium sp.]TIR20259.1 MAG: type II toxin-antitoxin system HicB family antitoxin [Mesorhizobium sp.]
MKHSIEIDGHKALVVFDPKIGMLRGEFLGLVGGADFYAQNLEQLCVEGARSLAIFHQICREKGIKTAARDH